MLSSEPRTAQRMSSIASTVFGDSLERASVMIRLTAEKSLSDQAELAKVQRMRLATSANSGNSRPFSFQNSSGELFSAGTRIALCLASSIVPRDLMLDCEYISRKQKTNPLKNDSGVHCIIRNRKVMSIKK